MARRQFFSILFIATNCFPSPLLAYVGLMEFQVNAYTKGIQNSPSITFAEEGMFVVAWESNPGTSPLNRRLNDADGYGIRARIFDSAQDPGAEISVNSNGAGDQRYPQVASNCSGDFLVVWESEDGPNSFSVRSQLFDSMGMPEGSEEIINQTPISETPRPQVAVDSQGEFVVVWRGEDQYMANAIWFRRLSSNGVPQAQQLPANNSTGGDPRNPDVGINEPRSFVIVWDDSDSIYGRKFDSSGTPIGGDFRLNQDTAIPHERPAITKTFDDSFALTWVSDCQPATATAAKTPRRNNGICSPQKNLCKIFADTFSFSIPKPQPGGRPISLPNSACNLNPRVVGKRFCASQPNGVFTAVWQSGPPSATTDSDLDIVAGQFTSSGLLSAPIQVNSYTTGPQISPAVDANLDGGFIVVWGGDSSNGENADGFDVLGRDIRIEINPIAIFSDRFESGDLSRWSVVVESCETVGER